MPLNWIIVNKFGLEKWGDVGAILQKASPALIPKWWKHILHFVKCAIKENSLQLIYNSVVDAAF